MALVARRLAQCLDPGLPSGVHQKTLEVYDYLFSLIGPQGLSQDLPLFLPGISSTLTFASLTVRPLFLSLVENHILHISASALRPALKALLLALLPGLEEEASDDFDRMLRILNQLKYKLSKNDNSETLGPNGSSNRMDASILQSAELFWQSLFLASITSPSRRTGALAYLTRYLPKIGPDASTDAYAVEEVTSPEPGLLIRCFATGLTDDQPLVQRGFLDLLVSHLPLNAVVFQSKVKAEDKVVLVGAAARVVLRRDMSLNRRLWTWLLGPEIQKSVNAETDSLSSPVVGNAKETNDIQISPALFGSGYFQKHGAEAMMNSLLGMLNIDLPNPSERAKPFRISLSLMDRWEIGSAIISNLFLPLMRSIQSFQSIANSDDFEEVLRSANAFFDGVEAPLVWAEIFDLIDTKSFGEDELERILLARFIIGHFNLQGDEMLPHAPLICLALLVIIRTRQEAASEAYARQASGLLNDLLSLLPQGHTLDTRSEGVASDNLSSDDLFEDIKAYYTQSKSRIEPSHLPISHVGENLIGETVQSTLHHLDSDSSSLTLKDRVYSLKLLLARTRPSQYLQNANLSEHILNHLQAKDNAEVSSSLPLLVSLTSLSTLLYTSHQPGIYVTTEDMQSIVYALTGHIWTFLSPARPQHQVEAVRSLWQLQTVAWKWRSVESMIAGLMNQYGNHRIANVTRINEEAIAKFGVLWNHTHSLNLSARDGHQSLEDTFIDPKARFSSMLQRPLLIVVATLGDTSNKAYRASTAWIQSLSRSLLEQVLLAVLSPLASSAFGSSLISSLDGIPRVKETGKAKISDREESENTDSATFVWSLQQMSYILSAISKDQWSWFARTPMSSGSQSTLFRTRNEAHEAFAFYAFIAKICLKALYHTSLQTQALSLLQKLSDLPHSSQLIDLQVDTELLRQLESSFSGSSIFQEMLIDVLSMVLKIRASSAGKVQRSRRSVSKDLANGIMRRLSTSSEIDTRPTSVSRPPEKLLDCLLKGMSSNQAYDNLDKWVDLFCDCLPLYSGLIFQDLLQIVASLCSQVRSTFAKLQSTFVAESYDHIENLPKSLSSLLNALESCLAFAHDRLSETEESFDATKSPDLSQGFFGNMVSGVFSGEANQIRNALANNRLTVILCFQDTIRVCFSLWSWESLGLADQSLPIDSNASFRSVSLRLRNRSRQILEGLFSAEPLECLETAIELWMRFLRMKSTSEAQIVVNLLHTLEGSRPKNTMPAIFNATYSRTNPSALDASRKSSVTTSLTDKDMMTFLISYTESLEDDVLEEIWADCTTFLRDVLGNPMPQRQILPRLLEFIGIIGSKMENTNFGEEWKMRRELGDLFLRLLTAIFTIKPAGLSQDPIIKSGKALSDSDPLEPSNVTQILHQNFAAFTSLLSETDRMVTAVASLSTNMIGPAMKSKHFPQNISPELLRLIQQICKVPGTAKYWKKDLSDAFNDTRFFQNPADLVQCGWLDLLRQLVLTDKDRINEQISRLIAPAAAGMMFGVGATAARLDTDRRTQYTLRRIALLAMATEQESFVGSLPLMLTRLDELSSASHISSPSSVTRSEIFMLLRALVLQCSPIHLGSFWPFISYEVQRAISSLLPDGESETYNHISILQAAKLLDVLLFIRPDEFQLQEWLFITDTVDAIYRPENWQPIAIADELSIAMSNTDSSTPQVQSQAKGLAKPWLCSDATRGGEEVVKILQPFFNQLSIHAYERTYNTLGTVDLAACRDDLLKDLVSDMADSSAT